MIHGVGGSLCGSELHSGQDPEIVTGRLTSGAEATERRRQQGWGGACCVWLRHQGLQGVAEGGGERVHERRLKVHESAKEDSRSRERESEEARDRWSTKREESASVDSHLRKTESDTQTETMATNSTNTHSSNHSWSPEAVPLSHVSFQVQEVYPFHDGWNVACFVILLLFILTVLSLAALAVLYELLDCGCCAKGKTHHQIEEEGPGSCSKLMTSICKEPESHTEVA